MATKVTRKELNECISEAISRVLMEDWENWADEVVNAALNDKRMQREVQKDIEKEEDAEASDEKKIEDANAAEAPVVDDEGNEENGEKISQDDAEQVEEMSYWELYNIRKTERTGTSIYRAAVDEIQKRNRIIGNSSLPIKKGETEEKYIARLRNAAIKFKQEVDNGEIIMPYGWKFDEPDSQGVSFPRRTHIFRHADVSADLVNIENSNGTNFHMLKTPMSARGGKSPKYNGPEVGMPDASWV